MGFHQSAEFFLKNIAVNQRDRTLGRQSVLDILKLLLIDPVQDLLAERIEHDDIARQTGIKLGLSDTVRRRQLAEILDCLHNGFLDIVRIGETDRLRGAEVTGKNDDIIFKADGFALSVGQAAVIQNGEELVEDRRVRLLNLIKQHQREGMRLDCLCELTALGGEPVSLSELCS